MNYYRRYVGDFQRDTGHLSLIEVGAYDRLLDHYYATEGALPDEIDVLCRICRAVTDSEKAAVRTVVGQFFPVWKDKRRHNNRADHELGVSQQARENGERGGRPRKTGSGTGSGTGSETGGKTGSETGSITGEGGGSGQPPTTNHQPPTTNQSSPQPSPSNQSQPPSPGASPPAARKRKANGQDQSPKIASTWGAYSEAYLDRWKAEPVQNATVNGQLAQVVKRLGLAEAPGVAAFYVGSNRGLYVSAKHPTNLLLRDCEALRTEWATGHQGTETESRQTDRTGATANVFNKLIEEAEAQTAATAAQPKE